MTFLDTSETLARILEALPPGNRLKEPALEFTGPADVLLQAEGDAKKMKEAPGWPGEFGILAASGNQGDRYLLWLGSRAGMEGRRQLVLYPPPGRYRIEYWTKGDGRLEGVEIATSTPLVLGPPGDGPYIVLIRRLT
jgi:hypothetical protein